MISLVLPLQLAHKMELMVAGIVIKVTIRGCQIHTCLSIGLIRLPKRCSKSYGGTIHPKEPSVQMFVSSTDPMATRYI